MERDEIIGLVVPIMVSFLLFGYVAYCWFNQKVHVRGKGWRSKDEAPKTFYFTVILLLLIGLGQLFSTLYFKFLK